MIIVIWFFGFVISVLKAIPAPNPTMGIIMKIIPGQIITVGNITEDIHSPISVP